jgi:glycosyltransferase involved in cell wall biosynthesis
VVGLAPFTVGVEKRTPHAQRNTMAPLPGVEPMFLPGWFPRGREMFTTASMAIRNGIYVPRHVHAPVDVMHLWNRVSAGHLPWGVTFESTLPRGPLPHPIQRRLQARLTSDRCRFVIGMSDQAVRRFLRTLPDDVSNAIAGKLARVHPYQPPQPAVRLKVAPPDTAPLRLLFVGKAFFRKGGEAVLRLIESYGDELNLAATVVSAVEGPDYATECIDAEHVADIRHRLASHPRLTWHSAVPNHVVYDLAHNSHIGLLPTLADTFGYSLLEFMSCGLPVVTSNVEATTEIVDGDVGWNIDLPLGPDGRWLALDPTVGQTRAAYDDAVETLSIGLTTVMRDVRANPRLVHRRSAAAVDRVVTRFGMERSRDLLAVYTRTCPDLVRDRLPAVVSTAP